MIRIGSDPEFWLKDENETLIPAQAVLPSEEKSGGANKPFYDGFQAEITTMPVDDPRESVPSIREAVAGMYSLRDLGITPFVQPAIRVPKKILDNCPKSVFEFGCSPSVNAYTQELRDSSVVCSLHAEYPDIMMAGGHIHIGMPGGAHKSSPVDKMPQYAAAFEFNYAEIILMFEMLGVSLLNIIECSDPEFAYMSKIRRKMYGLAGEYRFTPYGIEMRSPSCVWVISPEVTEMIYSAAAIAYYTVYSGQYTEVIGKIPPLEAIMAVNNSDVVKCWDVHTKTMDILQSVFGSKDDFFVSKQTGYKNIWSPFKSIHQKVLSNINMYRHYGSLEKAWLA